MTAALSLRKLQYFVAVADLGSFTRAAAELRVAQPALSLHVRQLEDEIGASLLVRGPRGVRPTEIGTKLADDARALLRSAGSLITRLRDEAGEAAGDVVIGLPQTVGIVLAEPLLARVGQLYPRIRIRLREALSGYIPGWIATGHIDFGISYNVRSAPGLTSHEILAERLYLVGTPGAFGRAAPTLRSGEVAFGEVAKLELFLPGRPHDLREVIERSAKKAGVGCRVKAEIDSLHVMKAMTLTGAGFGIFSMAAVHAEVRRGEAVAVPVVAPEIERRICLIERSADALSTAARRVAEVAVDVLRELSERGVWQSRFFAERVSPSRRKA
jgi:LysR family transcriptional regulator, nitrogen assimilation regulatory protein